MEHASVQVNRPWIPVALAVGIGAVMLLLASGPFDTPTGRYTVALRGMDLVAPGDTVDVFPRRFEWTPVDGAAYYVIGVARVDSGRVDRLFRQQGRTNVLELQFDPETAPPPGHYAWEVLAFGKDGLPSAKGRREFVLRGKAPPAPPAR